MNCQNKFFKSSRCLILGIVALLLVFIAVTILSTPSSRADESIGAALQK